MTERKNRIEILQKKNGDIMIAVESDIIPPVDIIKQLVREFKTFE